VKPLTMVAFGPQGGGKSALLEQLSGDSVLPGWEGSSLTTSMPIRVETRGGVAHCRIVDARRLSDQGGWRTVEQRTV
jgi:ABC-type hemin transport system ATPase subunit